MPDTIRQRLEAIRDIPLNLRDDMARERAFDEAVAALDLLNNAQTQEGGPWNTYRLVPDPEDAPHA